MGMGCGVPRSALQITTFCVAVEWGAREQLGFAALLPGCRNKTGSRSEMAAWPTKVQTRSVLSGAFSSAFPLKKKPKHYNNNWIPPQTNQQCYSPLYNKFWSPALGQLPTAALGMIHSSWFPWGMLSQGKMMWETTCFWPGSVPGVPAAGGAGSAPLGWAHGGLDMLLI